MVNLPGAGITSEGPEQTTADLKRFTFAPVVKVFLTSNRAYRNISLVGSVLVLSLVLVLDAAHRELPAVHPELPAVRPELPRVLSYCQTVYHQCRTAAGVGNGSTTTARVLYSGLFPYHLRYLEAHSNLCPVLRDLRRVSDHGVDTMAFLLLSFSIRFLGSQRPLE